MSTTSSAPVLIDFGHHQLLLPDFVLTGAITYDRRRGLLELHGPDGGTEALSVDLRAAGVPHVPR